MAVYLIIPEFDSAGQLLKVGMVSTVRIPGENSC